VRDSISLLDQLLADPDLHISLELAEQVLGTASGQNVVELVQALIENNAPWGLTLSTRRWTAGRSAPVRAAGD